MATQPTKPVAEFKLGLVKAVVWRNETTVGPRHNVTFARLFRRDDQWHETSSFGRDDLPLVQRVAEQAHTFIFSQKPEPAANAEQSADAS